MATTEHVLKLKAVLDTAQVRADLAKLRQQQQRIINQTTGGSYPSGGFTAQNNLANITQLSNLLNKLTAEIWRLDSSVMKLTSQMGRQMMSQQPMLQPKQSGNPGGLPYVPGSILGSAGTKFLQKALSDFFETNLNMSNRQFQKLVSKEVTRGSRIGKLLQTEFPTKTAEEANMFRRNQARDFINTVNDRVNSGVSARAIKGLLVGMGGGLLGQAAKDYQDIGWNKTATTLNSASSAMNYGSMGFVAGGPIGAGIGAIGGAIIGAFESLAQQAENLGKSFDALYKAQQNYSSALKDFKKSTGFSDWKDTIKGMSDDELKSQTAEKKAALDDAKRNRTAFAKNLDFEQDVARREYLAQMNDAGDDMDERLKVENKYTQTMKSLTTKSQALEKKVVEAQKAYDALDTENKDRQQKKDKKDAEEKRKQKEAEAKRKRFSELLFSSSETDKFNDLMRSGSLAEIEEQYKRTASKALEANANGDPEQFARWNPLAKQYQNAIQHIKDVQSAGQIEMSRMDESYQNSRILERYGIGGVRERMMDYARTAASERSRYEKLLSEGRLEEASKAKESWQFASGERNSLADTLLTVLGNKTADLTNVTSLGSIGANMGEVNDNFDRQMAVWEDQRNLQREIKNILNEKEFVAHYGE